MRERASEVQASTRIRAGAVSPERNPVTQFYNVFDSASFAAMTF
jgi:hypothetical protein